MSNENGKIVWGQVIVSCVITAFLSFFVGIAHYYYTNKSADLVYQTYPPAEFTKQATQISIYNARVENAGNKEVEDVQVYFELPSSCNIQDMKVEPSLKSINYSMPQQTIPNVREIRFLRLNQGESASFSILVDKGETSQLKLEVRGKGVIGHTEPKKGSSRSNLSIVYIFLVFTMIVLTILISLTEWRHFEAMKHLDKSHREEMDYWRKYLDQLKKD
jgi:disulfide bond formation protein DsbB